MELNLIKISLLHPSYGRHKMAYNTYCNWLKRAKNSDQIEYFLGLDEGDPDLENYKNTFSETSININIGNSTCAVQALDRIVKCVAPSSELLVEVLDDVDCFENWDVALFDVLKEVNNFTEPKMIGTHDGLRDYGVVFTQPIMNRACYEKLGFMVYPEYTSMFADNDFTEISRRTGYLINAPYILFKHNHYTLGLNVLDNTYARRNNHEEFEKNRKIFVERQNRNFDL